MSKIRLPITFSAIMSSPLLDTQRAFDSVAADYDGPSGNNALIQRLRARTMAAVIAHIPAGGALLDLGCGAGLDAELLARRGHRVTAIDWSPRMAQQTHTRIARAGLRDRVEVRALGIHELDQLPAAAFAGVYSDLGPLNCVPDLSAAARLIAEVLQPGGKLIASVIGRVCPWEWLVFGMKGQWGRARVRFARAFVSVPLNGQTVWTRYYKTQSGLAEVIQPGVGYLTPGRLSEAGKALETQFHFYPSQGRRGWEIRRFVAGVRLRREPARFGIWVGSL